MAGPGEGSDGAEVERRVVALEQAKAGVRLRADRRVVLAVRDLVRGSESATDDEGPGDARPAAEASAPPADADARRAAGAPNFHVQVELPDGSDYARNKRCVLEIPGGEPVEGTTNDSGELQLCVPNTDVETATLRVFDGEAEIAAWQVMLRADGSAHEGQPETAA